MPPSRCSSSSKSRSERSSRSRSASLFLICHQLMSVLLGGRPHHARQSCGHLETTHPLRSRRCNVKIGRAVLYDPDLVTEDVLPSSGDDGRHSTINCQLPNYTVLSRMDQLRLAGRGGHISNARPEHASLIAIADNGHPRNRHPSHEYGKTSLMKGF